MLVVAEPPSPLPRGPCPRAMRAAKSNVMRCKRMAQGRDPPDDGGEYVAQPRLKHSLRNRRAPPNNHSQTSMSLWFVSRHTDMEKVPAIVAGTRCFRNFRQTATALLYQFCINQPKIE